VSVSVGVIRSVVLANADLGPQAVILAVVVAMMMITTMLLPIAATFEGGMHWCFRLFISMCA
jgi:hypothetical protein